MSISFRSFAVLAAAAFIGTTHAQPKIADAWARPTVQGQHAGGGYLRIDNKGGVADRLLAASADVSASVELHTMTMEGDVMRMRRVDGIDVPAGQVVELKPGGLHVMFMGLKAPLRAGERLPLVLRFEKSGEVKTELVVGNRGPGAAASMPAHTHGHDHKH